MSYVTNDAARRLTAHQDETVRRLARALVAERAVTARACELAEAWLSDADGERFGQQLLDAVNELDDANRPAPAPPADLAPDRLGWLREARAAAS